MRERLNFLFLNLGHFLDHFFILVIATVVLALGPQWGLSYDQLIPYATPCFVMFGLGAIPSGWLADKWSREGMMLVFFLGIGAASILAGFAETPLELGACLLLVGVFASIYHPVGIAMVVHGREKTGMPLAVNGVFGNLGVASAALVAGFLIDLRGWQAAFILPGFVSIGVGLAYAALLWSGRDLRAEARRSGAAARKAAVGTMAVDRATLIRISLIVFLTTALGSMIFQCMTFALPKIFDERLAGFATSASEVGWWAFVVFAAAAFAQLVVGYLVDRHSARTIFLLVAGLQAPLFAIAMNLAGVPALVTALGFMLLVFGQIPINDVLVARITKSEWRSRAFAGRLIVGFGISSTAIPLISFVYGSWGFATLFAIMAALSAAVAVTVSFLPRRGAVLSQQPAPAE
ncbi:MAG TPA: MFS transporter [Kiloniellaceae bacterium]|nr:MFS transporter [Kiloniellaceae bacterium]